MGAVFVSYRRGDSEGQARALSLSLAKQLGSDAVFMDVDSIALGRDFREVLHDRLASCSAMMALIGPGWLDAQGASGRRLDSPTDYVRQEIAAALKRNIPVIPVLVQGAAMPPAESLPEDIRDLVYRNGFELGHSTWESDVREMVTRLGLNTVPPPVPVVTATQAPPQPPPPSLPRVRRAWPIPPVAVAAVALVVVIAAIYLASGLWSSGSSASDGDLNVETTPLASPSTPVTGAAPAPTATPSAPPNVTAPVAAAPMTLGANQFGFEWPGDDCWDVFRGEQYVTYQCGAKQQTLGPGRYTIKGKYAPVFTPFEIELKAGASTRVKQGGVLEVAWPAEDCWDIFRGEEYVTYQCGSKRQTLGAGRYTIKGKYSPVFNPFQVEVKDGSSTRVALGGLFTFAWPGEDCWDIFRGAEYVTYQCGTKTQALGAGTYTIKGKYAPVFEPFTVTVTDGAKVKAP